MKNGYRIGWMIAAIWLLQSCSILKEYKRPELKSNIPSNYRLDTSVEDSTSMADVNWKDIFTDTILQRYISTSLDSNFDMLIAIQNIEKANSFLNQANAGNIPVINAQLDYNGQYPSKYNGNPSGANRSFLNQYNLLGNLSWEADIWGKIKSQKKAAKAQYLQTVTVKNLIQTRLVASLASIYYQLLALDEQIKVANESIETRKESLQTTQALKDAGQLTAVAIKQTEAQVYDAQLTLLNLQKAVKQLENAFCILLSENPHQVERTTLESQVISTELKTGVPILLLSNRPDVISAEYGLMNAFELVNVAKASFYPTLKLTASTGLSSLEHNLFSGGAFFASLGAGLLQPILNRRQIRTQYETALNDKEIALLNYRKTILNAGKEVSDALADYQNANESMDIEIKQVDALVMATDYSRQLLKNGLATYLEVLTAQQSELGAQLQLINTKYERLNAIVSLYQSLGGGWK